MFTVEQILSMANGSNVENFFLLKRAAIKTTAAGKPFLTGILADSTGEIEAKIWDYSGPIGTGDEGSIVKVRGSISEYRNAKQLSVDRIRLTNENDAVDMSFLLPTAPIQIELELNKLRQLIGTIEDDEYRCVCETMLERHLNDFVRIPAAKSVHHSFINGLLMHTANMLKIADFLSHQYSEVLNRSLLLAGTLLHDFAKASEFTFSQIGLVTEYSVKGQLLGHLVMGAQEAAAVSAEKGISEEKSTLLQHMILSHHGEPEFGAAVKPLCAESELLSYIDMIDSRMEIFRETFEKVPVGAFSERIFALDKRVYHHN